MKRLFDRLWRANLYSLVIAAKIGVLILWQVIWPDAPDLFGTYALCLGLTSAFFIFAGMRARIYVFGNIDAFKDFRSLVGFMALFGVIAFSVVAVLYSDNALLTILLLVSVAKFGEMFLDANTSYIQKTLGRDRAFTFLNQHSVLLISGFCLGLIVGGLEAAVAAEIVVLIFTVLQQMRALALKPEPEVVTERGTQSVLSNGAELTLAATLNSAMVTGFLYWGEVALPETDLLVIAKVLTLQAFCARLITGNNIFFLKEFTESRTQITQIAGWIATAGLGVLGVIVGLYAALSEILSVPLALYGFGVAFTLINIANIVIRQQLLLSGVIRPLIAVHFLEILFLMAVYYSFEPKAIVAFVIFSVLRLIRTFFFINLLSQQKVGL